MSALSSHSMLIELFAAISFLVPLSLISLATEAATRVVLEYHTQNLEMCGPVAISTLKQDKTAPRVKIQDIDVNHVAKAAQSPSNDSPVSIESLVACPDGLRATLLFQLPPNIKSVEQIKASIVVGGEYSDELHVRLVPSIAPHGIIKMPTYISLNTARGGKIQISRQKREFYVTMAIGHPVDCVTASLVSSPVPVHQLLSGRRKDIAEASGKVLARFPRNVSVNACLVDIDSLPEWPSSFDCNFLTKTMFSAVEIAGSRGESVSQVDESLLGPAASIHSEMRQSLVCNCPDKHYII